METLITEAKKAAGQTAADRIRSRLKLDIKAAREAGKTLYPQFAYTRFAIERLLVRFEASRFAGSAYMKGGMLLLDLGAWRTTDDLDLTVSDEWTDGGLDPVISAFKEVCLVRPVQEDGLTFEIEEAHSTLMRVEEHNPTGRLAVAAKLHTRAGAMPTRRIAWRCYQARHPDGRLAPGLQRIRSSPFSRVSLGAGRSGEDVSNSRQGDGEYPSSRFL